MEIEDTEDAASVSKEAMMNQFGRDLGGIYPPEAQEFDLNRHTGERYLEDLKNSDIHFLVAELGGRIIGVSKLSIFGKSGHSHLRWICIHPSEQGKGYGERLIGKVLERCKEHGCHKVSLLTLDHLESAKGLYSKMGFVLEARLERHYWKVDFLLMSKWFDRQSPIDKNK